MYCTVPAEQQGGQVKAAFGLVSCAVTLHALYGAPVVLEKHVLDRCAIGNDCVMEQYSTVLVAARASHASTAPRQGRNQSQLEAG